MRNQVIKNVMRDYWNLEHMDIGVPRKMVRGMLAAPIPSWSMSRRLEVEEMLADERFLSQPASAFPKAETAVSAAPH
jgi:hypothetical protein